MPYFWGCLTGCGLSDTMSIRTRITHFVAFFFRSLLWSLNLVLAAYTCLIYWLLNGLVSEHWLASMLMISLPAAWLMNAVVIFLWLPTRPWRSWLSAVVLVLGFILFGSRTFVWHSPAALTGAGKVLRVFSYNVESFGLDSSWERNYSSPRIRRTLNFVLRYNAPVKCLQEVYGSTAVPDYNVVSRFQRAGYSYSVLLYPDMATIPNGNMGVAIFSMYPIIHSGRELFSGDNGLVWANIKVGNDTVRVISVHLHSMGIRVGKVLKQDELEGVKHETHGVLSALRTGFIDRREEVRRVERYIRESEYPVIVTGDHNDTPYSVVYERMRRMLPNSYEEAGRGFGFSYNHLPGFIRIDHQFHDPNVSILDFETLSTVDYSDHYPIVGTYVLK